MPETIDGVVYPTTAGSTLTPGGRPYPTAASPGKALWQLLQRYAQALDTSDGLFTAFKQQVNDALAAFTQVTPTKVEVFTSSGTWTKATGAKTVRVIVINAGQGGYSANNAGLSRPGGFGGARGEVEIPASVLPATVAVTVGAPGSGGTNGGAGAAGGASSFGTWLATAGRRLAGAIVDDSTTGGLPDIGGNPSPLGAGSGGGWNANASQTTYAGGDSGSLAGGAAPAVDAAGNPGSSRSGSGLAGSGGSSATSSTTSTNGVGGTGGIPGGGGGAGWRNASAGGVGGAGGRGEVIVITTF